MFTFVIDIHGELARFENTTPFLYPLQDRVYMVPLPENKFTKIPDAAEAVRKYLERVFIQQWQAIFLVNPDIRHANPLVGSLTHYLYTIKKKFLEPLKAVNLYPKNLFILTVDSLQRGQRGKPLEPENAVRWELDTRGIRHDSRTQDYTFNSTEVKSLDSLWEKKISIKDESFGRGLQGLSKELRDELKTRREKLEKGLEELVKKKKDRLLEERFEDEAINTLMLTSWENISLEFRERIEQILYKPDSAAVLENFLPSEILADVIKNNIGIHSESLGKAFTLIRYPFPQGHLQDYQKKIVQLTFLIIAMAENDLSTRLKKGSNYTVEIEEKDIDFFSQLLYDYRRSLQINAEEMKQKLDTPASASLNLLGYNTQKCSEELQKQEIEKITFDFFLDYDAVTQLQEWKHGVTRAIECTEENSYEQISRCIEQNHQTKTVERQEDIRDLRHTSRQLKNEYLDQVKSLSREEFISPPSRDEQEITGKEWQIRDALNRRPTKNQFLIISAAVFLILFLSNLYNIKSIGGGMIWGLVSVLAAAAAGYLCRLDFKKRISHMTEEIIAYAKGVILRIAAVFEQQKEYLLKLFNINIARKNYLEAQKARTRQEEDKVLLKYHLKELEIHLNKAENLCELYPLQNPAYEGLTRKDFYELELNEPVFRNNVYSPSSYRKNIHRHQYQIGVDEAYQDQTNGYLYAVDRISFNKDKVYPGED